MLPIKKDTPLKVILQLAPPCNCEHCNNGCKFGSGLLAGNDLKNIAKFLGIPEEEAKEKYFEEIEQFNKKLLRPKLLRQDKPYGQCIFFDEKIGCKVHDVKPLQCKATIQCKDYGEDLVKWFMLNYIIDVNDPESIRQYDVYLKTNKPIPGAELKDLVTDEKKLKKILSFEIVR